MITYGILWLFKVWLKIQVIRAENADKLVLLVSLWHLMTRKDEEDESQVRSADALLNERSETAAGRLPGASVLRPTLTLGWEHG